MKMSPSVLQRRFSVVVVTLACATACPEQKDAEAVVPSPSGLAGSAAMGPAAGAANVALLDLPPDTVIVEVNGQPLDRAAFGRAMQNQLMAVGKALETLPPELQTMVQQRAYMQLIEREILRQKGVEMGLVPPADVLEKSVADFTTRMPPGKTLDNFLADMKTDMPTFKKEMEANLIIAALIDGAEAKVPTVDEAAAKATFEANKAFYADNRSAKGRQIIVRALPIAPPEEVEKALARAKEIRASVVGKTDEQFAAIAREKTEDPRTRASGGDMGTVTPRDVLPELVDVVFTLKKGEVSEPVRSERGFHIIRGAGVTKGKPRTFADVKDQIIASESAKVKAETMDKFVRGIIESAKVVEHHTPPEPPRQGGFAPPGMGMGAPPPAGPPGGPGGMPPHGPIGGPPGGPQGSPGAGHGEVPLPSKDNVLPGMKNPHGAPGGGDLRLGGEEGLKLNPTP
jgi:hypothetical protein